MSTSPEVVLLDNATVTGSSITWQGGKGTLSVSCAGWNGATVTMQYLGPDGSTWLDAGANAILTANGYPVLFELAPGQIRGEVTVATPSSGVYAKAIRV